MSALRVAIVGAGLMGRWHAYYALGAGAKLTAIVDPDARAAAMLRQRYSAAESFADLGDCLARCAVEVVHICTPSPTHESLAQAALSAGKHVLVEKPAARSLDAARKLIALAATADRHLVPVHQFPFQRGFQRIRRRLDRLGQLVRINCLACTAGGEGLSRQDRHDLLLEILPHPVSLFRALCPSSLGPSRWMVLPPVGEELEVSGVLDDLHLSIQIGLQGRPPRNELTVIGTAGTAHLNLFHGCATFEFGGPSRQTKILQPFAQACSLFGSASANLLHRGWHRQPAFPGLYELIATFYRSIREDHPPPIDGREILEAAAFLEHLRLLAAQTGTPQPFRYDSLVPGPV